MPDLQRRPPRIQADVEVLLARCRKVQTRPFGNPDGNIQPCRLHLPALRRFRSRAPTAIYLEETFRNFDRNRMYHVLEFAPGEALHKVLRRYPFIAYRSADLSRKTVDERVDLTAMNAIADRSIDVLLCSHVLEHIPEDRKAMREIWVLKPDGFAVLLVPLVVGIDETS